MLLYNSNARLKPALIDQMIELLDNTQDKDQQIVKVVLPLSYKLLDDNQVKLKTEKLFKKLYSLPIVG